MATREDMAKIFAYLARAFPGKDIPTADCVEVYYDLLQDIDAKVLMLAAKKVAAENTFFPAAAELRQAAFRLEEFASGRLDAGQAWGEVLQQVWDVGSWGVPKFSDPAIERAVAAIGWENICMSEMPGVERAHFMKIYDQLKRRDDELRQMLPEVRQIIAELADGMRQPFLDRQKRPALEGGDDGHDESPA